jgi:hypothetical protein
MHTKCWFGKPMGKRALRRPRHRWEKTFVFYIGLVCMDRIHLAQDRDQLLALVKMVLKFWVPQKRECD